MRAGSRREERERQRYELVGEIFEFLRDRLPQYEWGVVEVAAQGAPPNIAFGGNHTVVERFVCLLIDRRLIDCAADSPEDFLDRLDLSDIEARLDQGDADEPVHLELD